MIRSLFASVLAVAWCACPTQVSADAARTSASKDGGAAATEPLDVEGLSAALLASCNDRLQGSFDTLDACRAAESAHDAIDFAERYAAYRRCVDARDDSACTARGIDVRAICQSMHGAAAKSLRVCAMFEANYGWAHCGGVTDAPVRWSYAIKPARTCTMLEGTSTLAEAAARCDLLGKRLATREEAQSFVTQSSPCGRTWQGDEEVWTRSCVAPRVSEVVSRDGRASARSVDTKHAVLCVWPVGFHGDVQIGKVEASVPIVELEAQANRLKPGLRQCYDKGLEDEPTMSGSAVFEARVDARGSVLAVDVLESSGIREAVIVCVNRKITNATFRPRRGASAHVTIAVDFGKR